MVAVEVPGAADSVGSLCCCCLPPAGVSAAAVLLRAVCAAVGEAFSLSSSAAVAAFELLPEACAPLAAFADSDAADAATSAAEVPAEAS